MLRFCYYALMICFPGCKINVGLYITNRRNDGYHNLETVFYPITGLNDALEIVPATSNATQLFLNGNNIDGDPQQNLAWMAYELVINRFPAQVPPLDIHLLKQIPTGAGLGGGSADAAFMLKLLNEYCRLELANDILAEMALQLGSDCPFFVYNTPQFAQGRGEQMTPMPLLNLSAYSIQIICPEVHISTKEAFGMVTPRQPMFDLRKLPELPVEQWKGKIANDFEDNVFMHHPALADIKKQLYQQGAVYASMSGSGSSIYGIFEKGSKATVDTDLKFRDYYMQ